jgi:hypothetical protein
MNDTAFSVFLQGLRPAIDDPDQDPVALMAAMVDLSKAQQARVIEVLLEHAAQAKYESGLSCEAYAWQRKEIEALKAQLAAVQQSAGQVVN